MIDFHHSMHKSIELSNNEKNDSLRDILHFMSKCMNSYLKKYLTKRSFIALFWSEKLFRSTTRICNKNKSFYLKNSKWRGRPDLGDAVW